jgi:hypothetical protein
MSKEKNSIDILLESLTDEQWRDINLRADSNRAHQAAERFKTKRESAIKFSEWILTSPVIRMHNNEGSPCWFNPNNQERYTSQELYNIYINGVWDEEGEDEDDEEELPIIDRGSCSECGEGYDNEEEWLYNTECEVCGHPIPKHIIVKKP